MYPKKRAHTGANSDFPVHSPTIQSNIMSYVGADCTGSSGHVSALFVPEKNKNPNIECRELTFLCPFLIVRTTSVVRDITENVP